MSPHRVESVFEESLMDAAVGAGGVKVVSLADEGLQGERERESFRVEIRGNCRVRFKYFTIIGL